MIVSEEHRTLLRDMGRLFGRLGLSLPVAVALPNRQDHLTLVPVLHAILDRIEHLERFNALAHADPAFERWKLEHPANTDQPAPKDGA